MAGEEQRFSLPPHLNSDYVCRLGAQASPMMGVLEKHKLVLQQGRLGNTS